MKWEKYTTEVELIEKQNDVEHDLYNIIANVIRDRNAFSDISLRDIGNRIRTKNKKEKVFWGLKGFPDFVMLNKEYQPVENSVDRKYIYGVIEAKFVDKPLYTSIDDKRQLWGHLLWFRKVIYTNGIEWRFYSVEEDDVQKILKKITSKSLNELQDDSYNKLAKKGIVYQEIDEILYSVCNNYSVDKFTECDPFVLRTISADGKRMWNETEWKRLIKYLDEYSFNNRLAG
ncbi:MAG: hypothetical protein ACI4DN_05415 [Lachnospiraceae bacterium]